MCEKNNCPCCGRHCDLNELHCDRGREYVRTGVVPEREHGQNKPGNIRRTANYSELDMNSKLIMNLRDLGHMVRFLFEGKGSQKRILIILHETGNMTQRELTEKMGVQPGSASEVIGKLESAGLILRTPSEEDRRTANIQLTESGRIQAEEAARQRKIRHKEMFSCLSAEEKDTLLALMEKLNADWDSRYHEINKEFGHREMHGKGHGPHEHHGHHGDFHRH